jgi:hypothetical protein
MVLDLSQISSVDVDQATHVAGDSRGVNRFCVGNLHEQIANREICVRVCTLLL